MLNIGLKYHKFFFFAKIKARSKYIKHEDSGGVKLFVLLVFKR